MEKQVKLGRAKSIGLSNFNEEQITAIWEGAQIKPSNLQVNLAGIRGGYRWRQAHRKVTVKSEFYVCLTQVELHAYMQQKSIRELCKKYNIIVTAYSPLGSPAAKTHFRTKYNYNVDTFPDLLNHPLILEIATRHKKTTAQILLRHLLQLGIVIIPKSSSSERIKSNIDLFDFALTEEDMKLLSNLDKDVHGRIFNFLFFKG